jgi:hypothetical protein
MTASLADQARHVLAEAKALREQVREDMRLQRWGNDDIQMEHYNTLVKTALALFPSDPVLGSAILMPDKQLKLYASPIGEFIGMTIDKMPNDLPCRRIEARLTYIIGRLQFILGGPEVPSTEAANAGSAKDAKDSEVRQIIAAVPPEVDTRDFKFVSEPKLCVVLQEDYVEAQRALAAGAYKASAVLFASVIEGMLLSRLLEEAVRGSEPYRLAASKLPHSDGDVNWDRVSLGHLITAAGQLNLLDQRTLTMAIGARDFRDTTHPRAEVREGARARLEEAELLFALAKLVYRDLASVEGDTDG